MRLEDISAMRVVFRPLLFVVLLAGICSVSPVQGTQQLDVATILHACIGKTVLVANLAYNFAKRALSVVLWKETTPCRLNIAPHWFMLVWPCWGPKVRMASRLSIGWAYTFTVVRKLGLVPVPQHIGLPRGIDPADQSREIVPTLA